MAHLQRTNLATFSYQLADRLAVGSLWPHPHIGPATLAAIDARIAEIDERLKAEFPDYAALVSPLPLSVEGVQALLGPDEALILILDTPEWKPTSEESFLWVVTKTGEPKWVRSELGPRRLLRRSAHSDVRLIPRRWALALLCQSLARALVSVVSISNWQQRHHDKACDGVLEENVAIPNEEEMDGTDKHQECQSADEQRDALRIGRQMVVLDREPHCR